LRRRAGRDSRNDEGGKHYLKRASGANLEATHAESPQASFDVVILPVLPGNRQNRARRNQAAGREQGPGHAGHVTGL
jgi:hypothetical protein